MKKTVIKCISRADWGRIIQWAEEIEPNCTYDSYFNINYYYGFNDSGKYFCSYDLPSDYTVLELSDFIAYPVKKEMWVSTNGDEWIKKTVVAERLDSIYTYRGNDGSLWKHAKSINPNQEKIDEIDRKIAELTKQKEELCNQQLNK